MAGFYDIKAKKLSGEVVSLADYRGKIVLVENTASLWGTTVRDFTQMNELCEKVNIDNISAWSPLLCIITMRFNMEI